MDLKRKRIEVSDESSNKKIHLTSQDDTGDNFETTTIFEKLQINKAESANLDEEENLEKNVIAIKDSVPIALTETVTKEDIPDFPKTEPTAEPVRECLPKDTEIDRSATNNVKIKTVISENDGTFENHLDFNLNEIDKENLNCPTTTEPKLATDLDNIDLLLPFKYGWRRSLVRRSNKSTIDLYYYNKFNKKFRSLREISDYLNNDTSELTTKNFSFVRRQILADDNSGYETQRDAYQLSPTNINTSRLPQVDEERKNSVNKLQPDLSWTTRMRDSVICTKRCRNLRGVDPTLKCILCMNLYHPQCVQFEPPFSTAQFVCINCKSSKTYNAELEDINSNFARLNMGNEDGQQLDPSSLQDSLPQSLVVMKGNKYIVLPKIEVSSRIIELQSDDVIQITSILPGNSQVMAFDILNTKDIVKIDIKKVDQD